MFFRYGVHKVFGTQTHRRTHGRADPRGVGLKVLAVLAIPGLQYIAIFTTPISAYIGPSKVRSFTWNVQLPFGMGTDHEVINGVALGSS